MCTNMLEITTINGPKAMECLQIDELGDRLAATLREHQPANIFGCLQTILSSINRTVTQTPNSGNSSTKQ